MLLGYNTNGLANIELPAALALLAEIGYRSVAITLDRHVLDPFADDWTAKLRETRQSLRRLGLASVIETGARFLLNSRVKHEPTLVSSDTAERARRALFLKRAIEAAAALESQCVSLWSGTARDVADEGAAWDRLLGGLTDVLQFADRHGVDLGFEPEPGMFVDTMDRFEMLTSLLPHPRLKLTLDIGHLHCQGEVPEADYIRKRSERLVNVHIEDMKAGKHEHLMFGEGEIDFPPIIAALADCNYRGGVHVELSRHAHEGLFASERAYRALAPLVAAHAHR